MRTPILATSSFTHFFYFLTIFLSILSLINAQTYYCDNDNPCDNEACCGVSDGETQGVSHCYLSRKGVLLKPYRSAGMVILTAATPVSATAMPLPSAVEMPLLSVQHAP
jgi:hypothetical protein